MNATGYAVCQISCQCPLDAHFIFDIDSNAMRKLPPNTMEILFELRRVNNRLVRVVAIDPITQTEVVMIGDLRQGEPTLKRLAARKLQYVLKKKLEEAENNHNRR